MQVNNIYTKCKTYRLVSVILLICFKYMIVLTYYENTTGYIPIKNNSIMVELTNEYCTDYDNVGNMLLCFVSKKIDGCFWGDKKDDFKPFSFTSEDSKFYLVANDLTSEYEGTLISFFCPSSCEMSQLLDTLTLNSCLRSGHSITS